jgi:hypothetical protein
MSIKLVSTGGGSVTIQEPNTASDFILSVPAATANLLTNRTAGTVLQVANSIKTGSQSTTSTSYVDVTDLSVSITPSSTSSKILVRVCINNISQSTGDVVGFNLLRGSTTVTSSTTSGGLADTWDAFAVVGGAVTDPSRQLHSVSFDYLDSPSSTSSLTYKVQIRVNANTGWINQWNLNTDVASVSTITVMEIAG